ncbi:MAG: ABC transporter permease [Proteobacteria bacterium]|nr:ABC transporter permease [Pseudomonadota bacterium]
MVGYGLRRVCESVVLLLLMSLVIYCLIGLMPGDPIDIMINSNPGYTAADAERLRALYGLDRPLLLRYWEWARAAADLDFGYSRSFSQPVLTILLPALGETVRLMGAAFAVTVSLSLVLGIASALRHRTPLDAAINLFAFAGISVPVFWLALMLIIVFAVWLGWLPASGTYTIGTDGGIVDMARYMVLPVVTLAAANTGAFTRYVRSSMIETMRMDFIRTARTKGVPPGRIVRVHALRNALIPVVTIMALSFGRLFSGALVTETMFGYRGMGKIIYESVMGNDFNLALVGLLLATAVTLLSNLLADLLYAVLDPRITLK